MICPDFPTTSSSQMTQTSHKEKVEVSEHARLSRERQKVHDTKKFNNMNEDNT